MARCADATWDTYGPVEGEGSNRDIYFAPDGKIRFDAITYYGGDGLRQVEIRTAVASGELRGGPYAFGPDARTSVSGPNASSGGRPPGQNRLTRSSEGRSWAHP